MAERQVSEAVASTVAPGAEAAAGRLMGEHRGLFSRKLRRPQAISAWTHSGSAGGHESDEGRAGKKAVPKATEPGTCAVAEKDGVQLDRLPQDHTMAK